MRIEYFYTEYEGKYIINICTYRNDDVDVQICVNGKPINTATELISLTETGADIKLKAYKPVLLSVDK